MSTQTIGLAPFFHSNLAAAARLASDSKVIATQNEARWNEDVCIFRIPEHLRRRWWSTSASELLEGSEKREGFEVFLDSFKRFAEYKGLPLRQEMSFDTLARPPGLESTGASRGHVVCLANIGDEATKVMVGDDEVLLEPGDGCWVPAHTSLRPGPTVEKSDLDILFQIAL